MTINVRILYTLSPNWNSKAWVENELDYSKAVGVSRKILTGIVKDTLWKKVSQDIAWTKMNDGSYQIRTDSIPVKAFLTGESFFYFEEDRIEASFDFQENRKTWYAEKIYDNVNKLLQDLYSEVNNDLANPIILNNLKSSLLSVLNNFWKKRTDINIDEDLSEYSRQFALIFEPFHSQIRQLSFSFIKNKQSVYGAPFEWHGNQPLHWECIRFTYYIFQSFCIIDNQHYIPWTDVLPSLPEYIDTTILKTRMLTVSNNIHLDNTKYHPGEPEEALDLITKLKDYSINDNSSYLNEKSLRIIWHSFLLIDYGKKLLNMDLSFNKNTCYEIIKDKKFRESILHNFSNKSLGHKTYLDESVEFWEHGSFASLGGVDGKSAKDSLLLLKEYFTYADALLSGYSRNSIEIYSLKQANDVWRKVKDTELSKKFEPYFSMLSKYSPERFFIHAPDKNIVLNLNSRFPNFAQVTNFIFKQLSLTHLQDSPYIQLPPILLVGNPGLGKTRYLHAMAEYLKLPIQDISMSSMSAGFILSGSDLTWQSAKPGKIADTFLHDLCANPLFILDELDKASGDSKYDPYGPLYQLLEKHTARKFFDEALQLDFDTSYCSWFATANSINVIPEPILSRFQVFNIPDLKNEDIPIVAQSIFDDILKEYPWGAYFNEHLDNSLFSSFYGLDARAIYFSLRDACANASVRTNIKPIFLIKDDISKHSNKLKIGF